MLCCGGKKRAWIWQAVMLTQGEEDEIGCGLSLRKSVRKPPVAARLFCVPLNVLEEGKVCLCVGTAETR